MKRIDFLMSLLSTIIPARSLHNPQRLLLLKTQRQEIITTSYLENSIHVELWAFIRHRSLYKASNTMQMVEYFCKWHNLKRNEFLMHVIESFVERKVRGRNWSTLKWFGGKDFGTPLEDRERIIGQNVNTGSDQFKGKKQIIMYLCINCENKIK